jgi:2-hydroxychromene-2-carboxylate isomerase
MDATAIVAEENGMGKQQQGEIAFWFDFASNYSYLSVMRISALAQAAGVTVRWKPFLLGPIFKAQGWDNSPFVLQKEKGAYVWRDMERQCAKFGLAWQRPSAFPRRSLLAVRVALLGANAPWIAAFCERVMLANFVDDADIDTADVIAAILDSLGLDGAATIAIAQSDENKLRLRDAGAEAQALGIFGAPSFVVNGELFWGNDRLDDAIAFAQA